MRGVPTAISDGMFTRELYRRRYVPNHGWVQSEDKMWARIQPKFSDAINRTSMITVEELFLNTVIFRDLGPIIDKGSFVDTTYTVPGSAEALAVAQTGTDLVNGDRLIEKSTGRLWIIRSIAEYRDQWLQHDEIITCEASHLDKKWIEPVNILTLTTSATSTYDPIFNQYSQYTEQNYTKIPAFGAVAFYEGSERFSRDSSQMIVRSAKGKMSTEPLVLYMDADWNVDENSIFELRGKIWKVEFIDESFFRVLKVGLKPFTERGTQDTLIRRPTVDRYVN